MYNTWLCTLRGGGGRFETDPQANITEIAVGIEKPAARVQPPNTLPQLLQSALSTNSIKVLIVRPTDQHLAL